MIPDRDLPHVTGDECPRCRAHDGEPHGAACERAREAAEAGPRLTAAAYCEAFATWRRASSAKLPRARVGDDPDALAATFDRLVAGGCDAVRAAFPDDAERAPDAYCEVFAAYLGERPEEDAAGVRDLDLAIRKSCLLSRLIYEREPLRTVPCPKHRGRWAGIHWPGEGCEYGCVGPCGCTTGWLPPGAPERVAFAVYGASHVDADGRPVGRLPT